MKANKQTILAVLRRMGKKDKRFTSCNCCGRKLKAERSLLVGEGKKCYASECKCR